MQCRFCGAQIAEGRRFCPACGAPAAQQPPPAPNPPQPQQPPQVYGTGAARRGSPTAKIIAVVLALALLVPGLWKPGYILAVLRRGGAETQQGVQTQQGAQTQRTVKGPRAKLKDGIVTLGGVTVDFTDTDAAEGSVTLTAGAGVDGELDGGLASDVYALHLDEPVSGSVRLSIPLPEGRELGENEGVLLSIGRDFTGADGALLRMHDYLEAEVVDGCAVAEFTPADFTHNDAYKAGPEQGWGTTLLNGTCDFFVAIRCDLYSYYEGSHFKLWYPLEIYGTEGGAPILEDLHTIEAFYAGKGYRIPSSAEKPMNVFLDPLMGSAMDGYYSKGSISISARNVFGDKLERRLPEVRARLKGLLYHEYFHGVQFMYLLTEDYYTTQSLWFDEATASYYQETEVPEGERFAKNTTNYLLQLWDSLIPSEGGGGGASAALVTPEADAGYARAALIDYVTKKRGDDGWIRTVYESWNNSNGPIEDVFNAISDLDVNFYSRVAEGGYTATTLGTYTPTQLYRAAARNDANFPQGTSFQLKCALDEKELQEKIKQAEEIPYGSVSYPINGGGTHLFALKMDKEQAEAFPDGYGLHIGIESGSYGVYKVKTGVKTFEQIEDDPIVSFKDDMKDGYGYLIIAFSCKPTYRNTTGADKLTFTAAPVVLVESVDAFMGDWYYESDGGDGHVYHLGLIRSGDVIYETSYNLPWYQNSDGTYTLLSRDNRFTFTPTTGTLDLSGINQWLGRWDAEKRSLEIDARGSGATFVATKVSPDGRQVLEMTDGVNTLHR